MHTVCVNSMYVYIWGNMLSRANLNLCHDKNRTPRKTKYIRSRAMQRGGRQWAAEAKHFQGSIKELCLFVFKFFSSKHLKLLCCNEAVCPSVYVYIDDMQMVGIYSGKQAFDDFQS